MNRNQNNVSNGFYFQWVLATAAGSTIAATLGGGILRAWMEPIMGVVISGVKGAAITVPANATAFGIWAAGIGILQWFILRSHLAHAGSWILATGGAWTLGGAMLGIVSVLLGGPVNSGPGSESSLTSISFTLAALFAFGPLAAILQWLILRREVHSPGKWIWASAGGFLVGLLIAFMLSVLGLEKMGWLTPYDFPSAKAWFWVGAFMGITYGGITGTLMDRLLRRPITET